MEVNLSHPAKALALNEGLHPVVEAVGVNAQGGKSPLPGQVFGKPEKSPPHALALDRKSTRLNSSHT